MRSLRVVARTRLIDHYRRLAREEAKLSTIHGRPSDDVNFAQEPLIAEAQEALRRLPAAALATADSVLSTDDCPRSQRARSQAKGAVMYDNHPHLARSPGP
jgi:hypothetical protein